jgi:hypothetical protein
LQGLAVNERMHFRGHDFDAIEPHAAHSIRDPLRGSLDVLFMFRLRADARYAQEFVEICQMLVMFSFYVFIQVHLPS